MSRFLVAAAAIALLPGVAHAQALQCSLPATVPPVHPELPSDREPQRLLPIGGYTLAITWAPESCYAHRQDPRDQFECGSGNRFGFTLHGLWPDGVGEQWPQYCRTVPLLPAALLRRNMCATPSAQLQQHEYAKHGSCMGLAPDAYFARSTGLYARLRWPEMSGWTEGQVNVGRFAAAVAAANPGMTADAVRVTGKDGWLDEIWFCLDKRFAYTRCRANSGGLPANAQVRIARVRS